MDPGGHSSRQARLKTIRQDRIGGNPVWTRESFDDYEVARTSWAPSTSGRLHDLVLDPWTYPTHWSRSSRTANEFGSIEWGDIDTNKANWTRINTPSSAHFPLDLSYPDHFDLETSNQRSRAITSVLNRAGNGKMELGADIGEMKQTVLMMADTARRVANSVTALKRGNLGAIPALLGMRKQDVMSGKFPANKWLEYQYGWKPLYSSIHDGAGILLNGIRDPNANYFSASAKTSWSGSDVRQMAGAPAYMNKFLKSNLNYTCRTKVHYRVSSVVADSLQAIGLGNPASIAWELLPFSFVNDWFMPVGNVLSAITASAGLEFISGYVTEIWDTTFTGHLEPSQSDLYSTGQYQQKSFRMLRVPLVGFPAPEFYTNNHPFTQGDGTTNGTRIASAVALIRQMF